MIGNESEAAYVASGMADLDPAWRILGEGSFRRAFLSPSGIVYKRPTAEDDFQVSVGAEPCNEMEWSNWLKYGKSVAKDADVRMAECFLFDNGIIAMEYIEGGDAFDDVWNGINNDVWRNTLRFLQKAFPEIDDMDGYCNTLVTKEGQYVLVDYAM